MSFLLDTCAISELVARRPNPALLSWLDDVDDERVYLSAITIGELKRGIERLPESASRRQLDDWLHNDLLVRFTGRILSIDTPVMLTWGEMVARAEAAGRKLPAIDSLIGALALHYRFHLVTRNVGDFDGTGVSIINPWD